jgi:hypothetical protein
MCVYSRKVFLGFKRSIQDYFKPNLSKRVCELKGQMDPRLEITIFSFILTYVIRHFTNMEINVFDCKSVRVKYQTFDND